MKQINITKMMMDNNLYYDERRKILGMDIIKRPDGNYIIKDSGLVISEKEKLQLENNELILQDLKSNCAKDITKKISKNKKRIEEIENEDIEETKLIEK